MVSEVNGLSVLAHELKAPLNLMRQLALLLNMDLETNSIPDARVCQQMVNVSERAILQVNDLLKIARLEDGLFAMEPVGVRGVCEMVARDVEPLYGFDRKLLKINYRNHQKVAIANTNLLYSVVYNFCVNAMHYSAEESTSLLTVSDDKDKIRISVRDFGPALPTAIWKTLKQGKLKQPTEIAMRPGSSGLGLYIATQFADYMHAKVGAVRHRDGASFFVDLPISQQACLFR